MDHSFACSRDQLQSTLFTLTQHCQQSSPVVVTARATKIAPTSLPHAQNRLLLELVLHHAQEDTSAALEHSLRSTFESVVAGDMLPGCFLKIHVFVLGAGEQVESVVANAVFGVLLMHGVPLTQSVFHYQWPGNHSGVNSCVLDLNDPRQLLQSTSDQPVPAEALEACHQFRRELVSFMSEQWARH